jgi:hypothetical protein
MGQAKIRGSFEQRKNQAIAENKPSCKNGLNKQQAKEEITRTYNKYIFNKILKIGH